MRAFIAVDLTREIRDEIAAIQTALGRFSQAIRWVRPESIHLTLKFLGEISTPQQKNLVESLAAVKSGMTPFEVTVACMGFFPNARAPRVAWLGIDPGKDSLQALALFVESRAKAAGFSEDERPFSPHVTIGRFKFLPDMKLFSEAVTPLSPRQCGKLFVREFHLYESQLQRGGSIYTKRATFAIE